MLTKGIVQYHLSATHSAYLRHAPSKLMLVTCRNYFQEIGAERLHLGGGLGGAEDSLYRFKAGFATDTHVFCVAQIVHDQRTYEELVRTKKERQLEKSNSEDFFPAYRAG